MENNSVLYPRSRRRTDFRGSVYLSARGGFGRYLRRSNTFPEFTQQGLRLRVEDTESLIPQLLEALTVAGIVEKVIEPTPTDPAAGYQVVAAAIRWLPGKGEQAFHDPIRIPRQPEEAAAPTRSLVAFYKTVASDLHGLEAREHTAQVPYEERQKREDRFREGKLPILYCSPTMELGVDISRLNVVICAMSRPLRPTMPSAADAPDAAGSPRWSSPTALPEAPMISTSSSGRSDGRRSRGSAASGSGE